MILQLLRRSKLLTFERTYDAPIDRVWDAWTQPDLLRQWWGPEGTDIVACDLDLRVGGAIAIVMEAGESMGKYAGTRWPLEGTFTTIEPQHHLAYEARSWTAGEEATTTIEHVNEVRLSADGDRTVVDLRIRIDAIGTGAKMAAFGMRWGYKAQLEQLDALLADSSTHRGGTEDR